MTELLLLACRSSAIERFLFEVPGMGARLVAHVLAEAAPLRPERVRGLVLPGREAAFRAAGVEPVVTAEPLDGPPEDTAARLLELFAEPPAARDGDALLLAVAPGFGPALLSRMRGVLQAARADGKAGVFLSALPVPGNCNPAWLHAVPEAQAAAGHIRLPGATETRCTEALCGAGEGLSAGRPLGSQWLPPLWYVDGAVTCIRRGPLDARGVHCVAAQPEGPCPLLYELPLFQMEDGQDIDWPLTAEDLDVLFEVAGGPADSGATPGGR